MSDRLAPTTTLDTRFFWDGLKAGKLLVQRCCGCAKLRHPPRPMGHRDQDVRYGRGEVGAWAN